MRIYVPERIWQLDDGIFGIVGRWDWVKDSNYPLYRTGYVVIAPRHSLYELPKEDVFTVDVHGGVTCDRIVEEPERDAFGFELEKEVCRRTHLLDAFWKHRVIGFDCAHYGDGYLTDVDDLENAGFRPSLERYGRQWTYDMVEREVLRLYEELRKLRRRLSHARNGA